MRPSSSPSHPRPALRRSRRWLPLAATALLLAPVAACTGGDGGEGEPDGEAARPSPDETRALSSGARLREAPRVRTSPVERRDMVRVLETTTVLESESEVELVPRTTGIAVEVRAEEGDHVEEDEVLARLDPRDAELAVRDAEVALEEAKNRAETAAIAVQEAQEAIANAELSADQAQRDFDRDRRLFQGDDNPSALSEQALETSRLELARARHDVASAKLAWKRSQVEERDARTAVSRAKVALERAVLALEHTEIRAPFSGVVAERSIRVGDSAGAEPVYVLTDVENLRAVFFRPQREFSMFAGASPVGNGHGSGPLEVTARAEAVPGHVFRGQIERTSPTIDPDSGSFRVTARLSTRPMDAEDADGAARGGDGVADGPRLLPGMLVRLEIVTDRHPDALVAPKRGVRREGDQSFVMVVRDGVAHRVPVEEGYSDDDDVELVPRPGAELSEGDEVVSVGARDLVDGARVRAERDPALLAEGTAAEAGDGADAAAAADVADADGGAEGSPSEGNGGGATDATGSEGSAGSEGGSGGAL